MDAAPPREPGRGFHRAAAAVLECKFHKLIGLCTKGFPRRLLVGALGCAGETLFRRGSDPSDPPADDLETSDGRAALAFEAQAWKIVDCLQQLCGMDQQWRPDGTGLDVEERNRVYTGRCRFVSRHWLCYTIYPCCSIGGSFAGDLPGSAPGGGFAEPAGSL